MNAIDITSFYWVEDTIVPIILSVFLVWFLLLVISSRKITGVRKVIGKFTDVSALREVVISKNLDEGTMGENFGDFCIVQGIDVKSPITKHIHTIFTAGYQESKLEVPELIRYTENEIFSFNPLLKGISSVFIIIGLFGTLIGLSGSLGALQPAIENLREGQQTELVADSMSSLFSHLSSAFTPSILGVLLTILSVFIFILYLKVICAPIKSMLTYSTIHRWVPELYLTNTQKVVQSLQESEKQLRQNFEAAEKVAAFAEDVQENFDSFGKNLANANLVIQNLSNVLANYQSTMLEFTKSVDALSSNQNQLSVYYNQISESNTKVVEFMEGNAQKTVDLQQGLMNSYEAQNARMEKLMGLFDGINELRETNVKLAATAENSLVQITERNNEVVLGLKDPLIGQLNENHQELSRIFAHNFERMVQILAGMDTPMRESAKSINEVFDNLSKSYDNLCRQIAGVTDTTQRTTVEYLAQNKQYAENVTKVVDKVSLMIDAMNQQPAFRNMQVKEQKHPIRKFFEKICKRFRK